MLSRNSRVKTSTDKIAKPISSLILFGVLKAYIKNPYIFMLSTLIKFLNFQKTLPSEFPLGFVKSYGFIALLYVQLRKVTSKDIAYEITRACILTSGIAVQQANFMCVERERTFKNLIKYHKKANVIGSTKLNKFKITRETDDKYYYEVTDCVFYNFFKTIDVPELTNIMCSIDNAIFNSYLPDEIFFSRESKNSKISTGNIKCTFCIKNLTNNKK